MQRWTLTLNSPELRLRIRPEMLLNFDDWSFLAPPGGNVPVCTALLEAGRICIPRMMRL